MDSSYAVIENGIVTNLIVWDGNTQTWTFPADALVVKVDDGVGPVIGSGYVDGEFRALVPLQDQTTAKPAGRRFFLFRS